MKVGFIGLGIMGKPMSTNLLKKGYELVVYDINDDSVDEVVKQGAERGLNGADVAARTDVVILMLPNSPHVDNALFGENGVYEGIKEGMTVIDMSSINPNESIRFANELKNKSVSFLDAPVSGGEPGAIAGTISVMVGGSKEVFDRYYDLMMAMSGSVTRCGEVGAGNTTKLANQMIVASNIAAVSEAFVFAKKSGVDPKLVFEAIKGGLAGSTVMNQKGPMMLEGNFEPGFRIALHIKDLKNAQETSEVNKCETPLLTETLNIMLSVSEDGFSLNDHSALVTYFEKLNDLKLTD